MIFKSNIVWHRAKGALDTQGHLNALQLSIAPSVSDRMIRFRRVVSANEHHVHGEDLICQYNVILIRIR